VALLQHRHLQASAISPVYHLRPPLIDLPVACPYHRFWVEVRIPGSLLCRPIAQAPCHIRDNSHRCNHHHQEELDRLVCERDTAAQQEI
jgi:hypothetical protein